MPLKILRVFRTYLFVLTVVAAAYTTVWDGVGLLWAGVGGIADVALFLVPALALPLAVTAWRRSGLAAMLFIPSYALNIGYQIFQFKDTVHQLLSRYSGFWEITATAFLLTCLAICDLVIGHCRGALAQPRTSES